MAVRSGGICADRRGDPGRRGTDVVGAPAQLPVPAGWRLCPARGLRTGAGSQVLVGGSPIRLITLSARGAGVVAGWWAGEPVGDDLGERLLARRLLAAALADPDPPPRSDGADDITIVVPVYGRAEQLERCLAALSGEESVIVVDDGSPDGGQVESVADRFGARYVRHGVNRGASAARNTGLRLARTELVAFLDSDCIPPPGFPDELLGHLADPAVALVAPRIVSSDRLAGRVAAYERCHSILDMGPHPSLVRPYSFVWYAPAAAMVARTEALRGGFDERLELGEDVDLVWRLHDAGWQVRYDPRTRVAHEDRVRPMAWYLRRVAYNESVVPLLERHPERIPVVFLPPAAALGWGSALSGWPSTPLALTAPLLLTATRAVRLRRLRDGRLPNAAGWAVRTSAQATFQEGRQLARALMGPWAPAAIAAVCLRRRRRGLALRLGGLLAAGIIADWLDDRPRLDPLTYGALRLAEESARGAGIWRACQRARDFRALAPRRPPDPSRR